MTAPKPFARPKSELSYRPVQNTPKRQLTQEERRNGVGDKPKVATEETTEKAPSPKPTPVKKPFELQPHLTHRPFAGLKQKLK